MSKNNIVFRKGHILVHDKELATISVWSRVSHGHRATGVITSKRLVVKLVTGAAIALTEGVAGLDHKIFNDAMKNNAVVKRFIDHFFTSGWIGPFFTTGSETDKIGDGKRGIFGKFDGDIT